MGYWVWRHYVHAETPFFAGSAKSYVTRDTMQTMSSINLAIQLDLYNQTIVHARFHLMAKRVYDFHFYDPPSPYLSIKLRQPRRYGTTISYQEQNAIIVGGREGGGDNGTCMCSRLANDSRRLKYEKASRSAHTKGTRFRPPATPMTGTDFSKNEDFVTD
ncbi:hypothetical protein ALC60_05422 [Trachymyrmex zeteki]|uniref:Uncharacterized protein n=1 Tax=Mycetomoellerius zeteki TaxID=64791 RepID=A0A151X5I2_9HYME|nr:hypothetical protein ALC60_05422 [Trachymyrmex zeteki]